MFYNQRSEMFAALLEDCRLRLRDAVLVRQQASLLVSGGSTPEPLYRALAESELPWRAISVALVDERWVDADQAGSNEAFIRQHLLQSHASAARYVATKTHHSSASEGLADCEHAYNTLPRPFDLVILGMGPDAHTASLFPHAEGLATALDLTQQQLCAAITAKPSAVTGDLCERLSLSLYGLMQSRQLHLVITGKEKLAVYQAAKNSSSLIDTPVSAILQQTQVPVLVYWAP